MRFFQHENRPRPIIHGGNVPANALKLRYISETADGGMGKHGDLLRQRVEYLSIRLVVIHALEGKAGVQIYQRLSHAGRGTGADILASCVPTYAQELNVKRQGHGEEAEEAGPGIVTVGSVLGDDVNATSGPKTGPGGHYGLNIPG